MVSALEAVILQHREALLRGDEATLRAMLNAYSPIRLRLIEQIEKLTAEVAAGRFRPTDAYRLDRWKTLLDQTEAEMTRLARIADPFIQVAQRQAMQLGILQSTESVAVQSPAAAASFVRLPTRAMQDVVGRLSDGSPLRSWLDALGPKTGDAIAGALRQAVAQGTNPRAVASALAKQVDVAGQRLLLTTRSTVLDSYRSASLENYRNNEDIVGKWEWLCALQARTCRVCLALDGRQFDLSEEFQKSHLACRCTSIPVLSAGPAIKRKRGSEWFVGQDAAVQDGILGKQAGAAYRNGEVALSDFVTLRKDKVWGDRYQAASFAQARRSAERNAA